MLAIDLGLFNRNAHEISYRNAAIWSAVWVTLALIFAGFLFGPLGWELFGDQRNQKAFEFLTGYVIELRFRLITYLSFYLSSRISRFPRNISIESFTGEYWARW